MPHSPSPHTGPWHPSMCFLALWIWLFRENISCSVVPNSATPWTVAHQIPLSIGFSRQKYQSGLPFPSLGDLHNSGIKPRPLYCRQILNHLSHQGSPFIQVESNSICLHLMYAAKSLQSCPTLCDLIDGSPRRSPVPGILQARTLEWVAISFSNAWKWKVKVKSLSGVQLFETPWTAAYQAPLPMGFSRQEYWSGLSLPSPHLMYIGMHF